MNKIWLDAGHGGNDSGAIGCGRMEKDDNLTYCLELDRQFRAQGMQTVLTRVDDAAVSLNDRTALERREKCDLAIACHRNSFTSMATGFEIWLHSAAPDSFVNWAQEICNGVQKLGMQMHGGVGVKKGYPGYPNDNYYANSGTVSPSMLIEFGYMQNPNDNAFFIKNYRAVCAVIVKASCRFLGVAYKPPEDAPGDEKIAELQKEIAELKEQLAKTDALRRTAMQNLADLSALLIAEINKYNV